MERDIEEQEPSVLEYARFHGLSKDYTLEQICIDDIHAPSDDAFDRDLEDPFRDPQANFSDLTKERLTLNKDAALLLKVVYSMQEPPDNAQLTLDGRKRILGLKQEVPLLRSDNELDLLSFGSAATPDLSTLKMPSEPVDEEKDEGFGWPVKSFTYPAQCDRQARVEKLTISKQALFFLQDAIRDSYTPEDSERFQAENLDYKPNPVLRPLTPPLLPLTPPLTPYIPSSPANHLELPSEDTNSIAADAKTLEEQIMAEDGLVRKISDESDQMLLEITEPPHYSPVFDESTALPVLKRRTEELKVEGPLTPPMFSESPTKKLKSVSFTEILHEYIPELPSMCKDGSDVSSSNNSFADFYKEITPLAEEAKRSIENERLSEIDTTRRVDIPEVDFTLPTAPWDEFSRRKDSKRPFNETELDAQMKFILRLKRNDLKTYSSWHGLSKSELTDLHWSPFLVKPGVVVVEEQLHGETVLSKMLEELTVNDIATSSTEVWKREGLRILEEDEESDEELEPTEHQERGDMETLIRKRKLEMEEESAETQNKRMESRVPQEHFNAPLSCHREIVENWHWEENSPVLCTPPKTYTNSEEPSRQKCTGLTSRQKTKPRSEMPNNVMMFGGFSASEALQNFMVLHGKASESTFKETERTSISAQSNAPTTLLARPTKSFRDMQIRLPHKEAILEAQQSRQVMPPSPLPKLPSIQRNLTPCSVIVSLELMQQRSLIKQIEDLYPKAELICRDFNVSYSPSKEADLLLSPCTGVIITTLQQVKQRALPGQPDRSPFKERMLYLQHRYERLIVMVGEGLSHETEALGTGRPADPRDKEAIIQLESFASQLEGEVLVRYVRGGEQAFARAIIGETAKYSLPHGSKDIGDIKPLSEETMWEIILRRAGLNPYAAQIILASLKQPFEIPLSLSSRSPASSKQPYKTVSVFGLPAFIMLGAEERVREFQALMGGNRILRRAGMRLDQEWVSAAHGFRM